MQTLCEHHCNIVMFSFKLGTVLLLAIIVCLFDHAQFLKLITVFNIIPKYKYLVLIECRQIVTHLIFN